MTTTPQRLARFAAGLWLLFAGIHLLGVAMTIMFRVRVGFWPVWFLDCVACTHEAMSVPYGLPFVGGTSIPAIAATVVATALVVRADRHFATLERVLAGGLGILGALHAVVTWMVRYPGSIPPVFAATVVPAAAAVAAIGAVGMRPVPVEDLRSTRLRGGWRSGTSLALGVAGGLALGGMVSAVAAVFSAWAARVLPAGARRYAIAGAVLGVAGLTLRMTLVSRFWMFIDWFP